MDPNLTRPIDGTSSQAVVNGSSKTCPSCGRSDAVFSNKQLKKKAFQRKCTICVSNIMSPCDRAENSMSLDPSQPEESCKSENCDSAGENANAGRTNVAELKTLVAETSASDSNPSAPDIGSEDELAANGNWSPLQHSDEDDANDEMISQDTKSTGKGISSIRDKMIDARQNALGSKRRKRNDSSRFTDSDDDDDDDDNKNISVEKLKQQILGRSLSSYDVHKESQGFIDHGSKLILDTSVFADGITVADHLRPHLSCPVCFERMYNPVSLLCGHSFCRKCLMWWLNRSDAERSDYVEISFQIFGTCPSCRNPIVGENKDKLFQVNTALKACMDSLYGSEMNQRRLAENREQRKATSGELGGAHQRGCEVLVALSKEDEIGWGRNRMKDEENGWVSLYASSDNGRRGATVFIRRSIVLDDCDHRYQLSLGFTKCTLFKGTKGSIVDVELCLLGMEEDEIDDSGFPVLVTEGSDDEALICTGNDRVHTCIESSARIASASELEKKKTFSCFKSESNEHNIKEVPLSRGMIGKDGSVRFRINIGHVLENESLESDENPSPQSLMKEPRLVKLIFCHVDTGATLEFRIPSSNEDDASSDGEIEFGAKGRRERIGASRFIMDADGEEDHDEPNQYEVDGFVVGSQDTDEGSDEEDGCDVCKHGGDLIVCDGGDNDGGCGKSFHLECINRREVPPGDWICGACANNLGINVGIEGHEYAHNDVTVNDCTDAIDDESEERSQHLDTLLEDDTHSVDQHSEEEAPLGQINKKNSSKSKRRLLYLDESGPQSDDNDESKEGVHSIDNIEFANESNSDHSEEETPVIQRKGKTQKMKKRLFIGSDEESGSQSED
ncbi:hypothetical protein ACHAW6_009733 [Cyclotella cf. meneghiniana]